MLYLYDFFKVLKTRMALRKTDEVRGIIDCIQKLHARDGLRGFFKGYVPNLIGIIPYAGIDLTVYEVSYERINIDRLYTTAPFLQTLKNHYLTKYHSDGSAPPAVSLLAFGTVSSCCGQVAAYPLALVRTKLQSQGTV